MSVLHARPVLRLAVDARFAVLDERGIGRYTRALLARFAAAPNVRLTLVAPGLLAPRRRIAAAAGVAFESVVARVPADASVLWSPSNGTDLVANAPCVTTVHDIVPFAFPAADARVRMREEAPLLRTATLAHRIIADSGFMAEQIAGRLGVRRERIVVVPLGTGAPFAPAGPRHVLPDGRPYILHVGAHDARKNVATLVAAWQRAFPAADVALVFTRAPAVVPEGAVVVAAPGDDGLAELYRGARLVAVPSLDEGFGLPLLEALACAAPAIASRAAALPEVGGDAVAWIDEPRDVALWSAALARLVLDGDETAALRARGPVQAAAFTWERSAALTLDVLRAAAASA
jgi:glycosyltransferase involved in cell wall biosynthesis